MINHHIRKVITIRYMYIIHTCTNLNYLVLILNICTNFVYVIIWIRLNDSIFKEYFVNHDKNTYLNIFNGMKLFQLFVL